LVLSMSVVKPVPLHSGTNERIYGSCASLWDNCWPKCETVVLQKLFFLEEEQT